MKLVRLAEVPDEPVSHNAAIRKRVMLASGDVPNVTQFAQSVFRPGQVAAVHVHRDMAEVFLVTTGEGAIEIDGAAHRLTPGTCVAVHPGERHEIRNDGSVDLVLTYFGVRAPPHDGAATTA
jgi:mannose-6-phosphate isomerase-like protein (cupin superfamily)